MLKYHRKMTMVKMCGLQIRLFLFIFRTITLKQFNSLITIDTFSCLCGQEATHRTAVREVPSSTPVSGKDFNVWFFVLWFSFYVFAHNTLLSRNVAIPFAMLIHLVFLTNCNMCEWSKRVSRYRPSIFKLDPCLQHFLWTSRQFSL